MGVFPFCFVPSFVGVFLFSLSFFVFFVFVFYFCLFDTFSGQLHIVFFMGVFRCSFLVFFFLPFPLASRGNLQIGVFTGAFLCSCSPFVSPLCAQIGFLYLCVVFVFSHGQLRMGSLMGVFFQLFYVRFSFLFFSVVSSFSVLPFLFSLFFSFVFLKLSVVCCRLALSWGWFCSLSLLLV